MWSCLLGILVAMILLYDDTTRTLVFWSLQNHIEFYAETRDSLDSPDRMHSELILRSGGYLNQTASDISEQPDSLSVNTQQLLARTIDTQVYWHCSNTNILDLGLCTAIDVYYQGLSTGVSTNMLDTNKLLADTLRSAESPTLLPQRAAALRYDHAADNGANVNDSVDSGMYVYIHGQVKLLTIVLTRSDFYCSEFRWHSEIE